MNSQPIFIEYGSELLVSGVSGKGFLAPGNGKGNCKSHSLFTGRERELENAAGGEGKFEARNPGKSQFPAKTSFFPGTGREI